MKHQKILRNSAFMLLLTCNPLLGGENIEEIKLSSANSEMPPEHQNDFKENFNQDYEEFLSLKLAYTPYGETVPTHVLPIAALENPLYSSFDLSPLRCFGTLSMDCVEDRVDISTGYKIGYNVANHQKIEVWIALRKNVVSALDSLEALHLIPIMDHWPEEYSVGIFFNKGSWFDKTLFDYYTFSPVDDLINRSFSELLDRCIGMGDCMDFVPPLPEVLDCFSLIK